MIDIHSIINTVINTAIGVIVGAIINANISLIKRFLVRTIDYNLVVLIFFAISIALLVLAFLEHALWLIEGIFGIFGVIVILVIYRRYFDFPFRKWRVNNNRSKNRIVTKDQKHNCGLLALHTAFDGIPIGKTWMFKTNKAGIAVYGPYIALLGKGKYKAVFKIKVMVGTGLENENLEVPIGDTSKDALDIIKLDIASCRGDHGWGEIPHGQPEPLTTHSFKKANKYQKFTVEFRIKYEKDAAKGLEMRIDSNGNGHIVVLDYIKLSRRLF